MELLGIRVQRDFCSLGGGSTRKEELWREYIYRSCLNGCVVRVWCLRGPLRKSGGLGTSLCRATQQVVWRVLWACYAVARDGHWGGRFT